MEELAQVGAVPAKLAKSNQTYESQHHLFAAIHKSLDQPEFDPFYQSVSEMAFLWESSVWGIHICFIPGRWCGCFFNRFSMGGGVRRGSASYNGNMGLDNWPKVGRGA
jgi:hypothetical protein